MKSLLLWIHSCHLFPELLLLPFHLLASALIIVNTLVHFLYHDRYGQRGLLIASLHNYACLESLQTYLLERRGEAIFVTIPGESR